MKNTSKKKKILIFSEYYLPGYKSGGGMRTIVNIVSHLNDEYDFFIVTKNIDGKSEKEPYKNITHNEWNDVEGAKVFYLSNKEINFTRLLELYSEVQPDILYSNSYFSKFNVHLLVLNKLRKLKELPYIISPCGELSEDSFRMGTVKKNVFLNFAKSLKLHRNIVWKASTEVEKKQIEQLLGENENIHIAPDLIPKVFLEDFNFKDKPIKDKGSAKLVFLSRFNQKKNFKFLLENIINIKGDLHIDIIGPIDDEKYWNDCMNLIANLPENIKVFPKGSIPHKEVVKTLINYHFFVLPTQHENFGHIFLEALSAGCPIIISNRTPWLNLRDKNIGWDIALEDSSEWEKVLQSCVDMSKDEYKNMSSASRDFIEDWVGENDLEKETRNLFEAVLSKSLSKVV